ncbi:bifunctional phosphoribosylaminoimidazolecarboxamide formyltransferase/IMP cyclohydrolase [Buchnera aphidicola]|uniref:bifunctional phosphoribosylaminoimidazolecarboxamide formyltransferase/IMP cyclohydrolase n=1 Tax=Buchnera aphidicola TaxID=9 RepID=UPI003463E584
MEVHKKIQNALISVFNKNKILILAKELIKNNITIFATNKTENLLKKNNIPVKNIFNITKKPEILHGKIKTIHPEIFSGILGNKKDNTNDFKKKSITFFDLVIVNFYLFDEQQHHQNIECIDIGGPSLARASAKNYENVTIVTDITDYDNVIKEINTYGSTTISTRIQLAKKAFQYTHQYDYSIMQYFNKKLNINQKKNDIFPKEIHIKYTKQENLKYGENPHQKAALYIKTNKKKIGSIDSFKQINGNKLSYNNIYDAHIAYECVNQFEKPTCIIVKHGNPCGASSNQDLAIAYLNAYSSNPISAFGGIISFNKIINTKIILIIIKRQFVEIIIGPEITQKAKNILKLYPKIKVLICGYPNNNNHKNIEFKTIGNSLLVQKNYENLNNANNWNIVSNKKPSPAEIKYAIFAWKITKFIKSNAILYSDKYYTIGIGSGQTNRLESVKIANKQYNRNKNIFKLHNRKIIMTSDAFFPFRDSIDTCIHKNISCIVQPGGSIRDQEVIRAANEYNISMIFTNQRIFTH